MAAGRFTDRSGAALRNQCDAMGWSVGVMEVLPDEKSLISGRIETLCQARDTDLILTTGGTGLGPRDVTPEATMAVAGRLVPGFGELMRMEGCRKNPRAVLSRGIAAQCGQTLIVNLPGSPAAAVESFRTIAELVPHALEVMRGGGHEPPRVTGSKGADE